MKSVTTFLPQRTSLTIIASIIFILIALLSLQISPTEASTPIQVATPIVSVEEPPSELEISNLSISDETCLECHGQPGQILELENEEPLDLFIPTEIYNQSLHGKLGYACVQCHTEVGNYPHPKFTATSRRDASIQLNSTCQRCHASQYAQAQDSVHSNALSKGVKEAAICTDCHTAHGVKQLNDPETKKLLPETRIWIPETCSQCHHSIFQKYRNSVHGIALINENNTDVPTCIDCHGVHNIEDPRTTLFRLNSPQICAKCHSDAQIMEKYGISTDVLDTYVADFHGTTVVLFEKQTPDAETNKPVCYDCHGIHDINRANDPEKGLLVKENLLARCRICHPDAGANFPNAWLSHYIPSADKYPIVYYVNLFYKIFIPTILGGMALLVALDFNKKYILNLIQTYLKKSKRIIDESKTDTEDGHSKNVVADLSANSEIIPPNIENNNESNK